MKTALITILILSANTGFAQSQCKDTALAKKKFVEACMIRHKAAHEFGSALKGQRSDFDKDKYQSHCDCLAKNFRVENTALPDCDAQPVVYEVSGFKKAFDAEVFNGTCPFPK